MDKHTIHCNYKSRQLLLKVLNNLKNKEMTDLHLYFTILLVSWISNDNDIFIFTNNDEFKNKIYENFHEDNFLTFINIWINYFSINNYKIWAYENYIDENTIYKINSKKNEILTDLNKNYGYYYPYEFKTNFINYSEIQFLEILNAIKKEMISCFISNLYYKNPIDDYSFLNYNDKSNSTKYVIDKNIDCAINLGEPKYYFFCFKSLKKGDNFFILQKVIYLDHKYIENENEK